MTFSTRVALLTAGAVALAAIGAAILMYVVLQQQLVAQIDQSLIDASRAARESGPRGQQRPFPPFGDPGRIAGRGDVFAQSVDASGKVVRADLNQPDSALVTAAVRRLATDQQGDASFDVVASDGTHVRVYAVPIGNGTTLEVARSLAEVDRVLDESRNRLALVAVVGVLVAGALGTFVARTALVPVRRLTNIVEEVSRTRDLSQRVSADTNDELGRLATQFNVMLGELETSLRSQRQLVADASHELRTPLTSLRTNLELLERGQPTDPTERGHVITDLVGQMERLSTLVSDLIDLARDEKTQLIVEDVRLDQVAEDAIAEMRLRYPNVRFQLDGAASTVNGVRSRILRAITNLLDNAGKWSPPGGIVEVSVRGNEITVRDHGPGIAPEDEQRVFDRFWRAPAARQLPGSGLGLAIVKDVAETHGGRVTLERPTGGGAFFRLRLGAASVKA